MLRGIVSISELGREMKMKPSEIETITFFLLQKSDFCAKNRCSSPFLLLCSMMNPGSRGGVALLESGPALPLGGDHLWIIQTTTNRAGLPWCWEGVTPGPGGKGKGKIVALKDRVSARILGVEKSAIFTLLRLQNIAAGGPGYYMRRWRIAEF